MSAAVASQRGSGCCDGTPAAGNGTRTDRERSREQGGVRVAGGGGRRGPVCLRSKSLNSLCTQSHAASMSPLIPSPSRRAGISCAGDARADRFSEHLFFYPPEAKALSSLLCPSSSISAPSRTMSFGALPGAPPLPAAAHPMSTHDALMRPLMCGQCGRTAPHQRCILQLSSVRATFRA